MFGPQPRSLRIERLDELAVFARASPAVSNFAKGFSHVLQIANLSLYCVQMLLHHLINICTCALGMIGQFR
jgi:hypothetical protein